MSETIFHKIKRREIPSEIVYEDDHGNHCRNRQHHEGPHPHLLIPGLTG